MIRNTITQKTAGLLAVSFMLIPAIPVSAEAGPGAAGSGRPPVQQEAGIPYRQGHLPPVRLPLPMAMPEASGPSSKIAR